MKTHISFLRGINVSGQKIIKMDALKKAYENAGFENVKNYVQSGNIIFSSPKKYTQSKLEKEIEALILKTFAFDVTVIVRTPAEVKNIIENNPFANEDPKALYVTLLTQSPDTNKVDNLNKYLNPQEKYHLHKKEIYLHCPTGYGKTKFSNNIIEKVLETKASTRNWNSLNKVYQLALQT